MAELIGPTGPLRSFWPPTILQLLQDDIEDEGESLGTTVDTISERTIIERMPTRGLDMTRRMGLFLNNEGQDSIKVVLYGFVKAVNFHPTGDWKGSRHNAHRARSTLTLGSGGFENAFRPQIEFARTFEDYVAEQLHISPAVSHTGYDTLELYHIVFRKALRDENLDTYTIPRGVDPTGRVARMASRWRLNDIPQYYKRLSDGNTQACTGSAFRNGDFVKVVARLDLTCISGDEAGSEKTAVGLAIVSVTRIATKSELEARKNTSHHQDPVSPSHVNKDLQQ